MRIPDSVKIGPYTYRVEFCEAVVDHENAKLLYGQVDHMQHWIRLGNTFPPDHQAVTFLHEVLHALDAAYDLDLSERQIDLLGVTLMAFLKDNGFLE